MKISYDLKVVSSGLTFLLIAFSVKAQQKRIYIANDDHTDYVWSADEDTYRKVFVNNPRRFFGGN